MPGKRKDYGLEADPRGVWHCDFSVAGRRFQRSTFTTVREAAEEWCAALAERAWREIKLGEKPALTWEEAVAIWFREKEQNGKKDLANDEDKKIILAPYLDGKLLHTLHVSPNAKETDGVNIVDLLDELQEDRDIENATRNRYRAFIDGVLNLARGKGYNVQLFKIPKRTELREEPRALTYDEAPVLIRELPLHLKRPARFSLACGHRQSNVMGLRWFRQRYAKNGKMLPHVTEDLCTMVVPGGWAKSGKMMHIPLNADAQAVLREARDCEIHGHTAFVFTYYGAPIQNPYNTAFKAAVVRAEVPGFTWHGFRHTWTTWHLTATPPTPLEVVQRLGGWSSIQILLKHYAHLLNSHVAKYAGNVSMPTAVELPALRSVA
jgi:integrase